MVQDLRADILRLTERLTRVVASNAELLQERSSLTARAEVRAVQGSVNGLQNAINSRVHCAGFVTAVAMHALMHRLSQ